MKHDKVFQVYKYDEQNIFTFVFLYTMLFRILYKPNLMNLGAISE